VATHWTLGSSSERRSVTRRVTSLAAQTLRSFDRVTVHGWDSAALKALRIGGERRRRVSNRSVVAPIRDREREGLLLMLLVRRVHIAAHTAFDLMEVSDISAVITE
jgi:hypothetical protein